MITWRACSGNVAGTQREYGTARSELRESTLLCLGASDIVVERRYLIGDVTSTHKNLFTGSMVLGVMTEDSTLPEALRLQRELHRHSLPSAETLRNQLEFFVVKTVPLLRAKCSRIASSSSFSLFDIRVRKACSRTYWQVPRYSVLCLLTCSSRFCRLLGYGLMIRSSMVLKGSVRGPESE